MLPSTSAPSPRVRSEQMLWAKVVTALGLALLLVVGAWSTSGGDADVHAGLCLASGASTPSAAAEHHDGAAAVDVLSSDAALCVIAVLCGVALLLLVRRLPIRRCAVALGRASANTPPVRAGPARIASALTLIQLSICRT